MLVAILLVLQALIILPGFARARDVLARDSVLTLACEGLDSLWPQCLDEAEAIRDRAFGLSLGCLAWFVVLFTATVTYALTAVAPDGPYHGFGLLMLAFGTAFAVHSRSLEERSLACDAAFRRLTGENPHDIAHRVRSERRRGAA